MLGDKLGNKHFQTFQLLSSEKLIQTSTQSAAELEYLFPEFLLCEKFDSVDKTAFCPLYSPSAEPAFLTASHKT